MIDVAAGLALDGKLVYVYAMAPFVTLRCYEQIKVALAAMGLPVTIVGVGVGLGYDEAGPTHHATEDLACMRALAGIEIVTPADTQAVAECARHTVREPRLRYVRLDRQHLPDVYAAGDSRFLRDGLVEVDAGAGICVIAHGYMLKTARASRAALAERGVDLGVIDAYRVKPIEAHVLVRLLERYSHVVTLEEHVLSGGLGAALLEAMADAGVRRTVTRLGIADRYYFENGGRTHLHRLAGLDAPAVVEAILAAARIGALR